MANLTADIEIAQKAGEELRIQAAAAKNYRGGVAAVVLGTGYATPLRVATAGMQFIGVYLEGNDNSSGVAGTIVNGNPLSGLSSFVRIARTGLFPFTQSGLTQSCIGKKAYFSDDNTVVATPTAIEAGVFVTIDEILGQAWVDIGNAVRSFGALNVLTFAAPVTTTNVSGAAQILASLAVPANTLKAGDRLHIKGQVMGVTRTSTDTTALALLFGSTTIATLAAAFAHATTNWLYFDIWLDIRTDGAGGTAYASGITAGGTAGATVIGVNMASATFDTTIAEVLAIQGTFSASNTSDQIAVNLFDVEIVRS